MEETPLEAAPTFTPPKRKINKRFVYLITFILAILLIFFGFKILGSNKKAPIRKLAVATSPSQTPTNVPSPSNSPTPIPTNSPTPTPTVNPVDSATGLDRSKLSVTVQNGSGEQGAAGKAETVLKNLGYDVIATGNADNFNYSGAVIQVKDFDSDYLSLLAKDLGFSYTIGSTSADLSDSFSSDALVIIGK